MPEERYFLKLSYFILTKFSILLSIKRTWKYPMNLCISASSFLFVVIYGFPLFFLHLKNTYGNRSGNTFKIEKNILFGLIYFAVSILYIWYYSNFPRFQESKFSEYPQNSRLFRQWSLCSISFFSGRATFQVGKYKKRANLASLAVAETLPTSIRQFSQCVRELSSWNSTINNIYQ